MTPLIEFKINTISNAVWDCVYKRGDLSVALDTHRKIQLSDLYQTYHYSLSMLAPKLNEYNVNTIQ